MTDSPDIAAARIEVERRRSRVVSAAHQLQDRLSPKVLARDAWAGAKEKGATLAEDAVDAVKARPLAAGGVVAAIAMFLAREPLIELAGQLVDGVRARTKSRAKPKPKKAPVRRSRASQVKTDKEVIE